jgi:hypothetical protein
VKRFAAMTDALGRRIALLLALGLLLLFCYVAYATVRTADTPPRLADPAPTAAPTPGPDGSYPEQLRGGFDPNARLVGLLALVSPLLTTVVGFYFGQRAGDASATAADAQKEQALRTVTQLAQQAEGDEFLHELQARGLARE